MKLSSPLAPEIFFHVVVLKNFGYFVVEHVNDISNFKIVLPLFAGPCFNHLAMGYFCNRGGGGRRKAFARNPVFGCSRIMKSLQLKDSPIIRVLQAVQRIKSAKTEGH